LIAGTVVLLAGATATGQVAFTTFHDPGTHLWQSVANAVSADGSVVVGYAGSASAPGQGGAVRWTAERGLEFLDPVIVNGREIRLVEAQGVSADGRIIAGSASNGQVFRWEEGAATLLFGAWYPANAYVTPDGSMIVGTLLNHGGVPFGYDWTAQDGFGTYPFTP